MLLQMKRKLFTATTTDQLCYIKKNLKYINPIPMFLKMSFFFVFKGFCGGVKIQEMKGGKQWTHSIHKP